MVVGKSVAIVCPADVKCLIGIPALQPIIGAYAARFASPRDDRRISDMTDDSKAWVWNDYRGVVDADATSGASPGGRKDSADVVRLRTVQGQGQKASGARAKFGVAIAVSVLAGAAFPLLSFLLLLIAALLIASGREPEKTRDALARLPGGDYVNKAVSHVDGWLS
jgi:hypothetical protein